jgi:probable F420-dependent oxidoreductase
MAGDAVAFGLNIPMETRPPAGPVSVARAAQDLGFDFVSLNDHVHGPDPRLEAWTALAWIGAATSRIRLATRVLGVPYRHPAIVAKMAETFDRLSAGRLILGLGAGSGEDEFRALGLAALSLRERIEGLEEAIQIVRGLWTGQAYSFQGKRYRVSGAQLQPKPAHRIPIWLGNHGRRGLELTGRLADGWIPSLAYAPPEEVGDMVAIVRQSARDAGRDPHDVTCIYNVEVSVGHQRDRRDHVLSGSPAEVAERLVGLLALGFDGFNLIPTGRSVGRQITTLGLEVVPAVRAAV